MLEKTGTMIVDTASTGTLWDPQPSVPTSWRPVVTLHAWACSMAPFASTSAARPAATTFERPRTFGNCPSTTDSTWTSWRPTLAS